VSSTGVYLAHHYSKGGRDDEDRSLWPGCLGVVLIVLLFVAMVIYVEAHLV